MPKAPTPKRAPSPSAPEVALPFAPEELRTRLSAWYARHARALPWRGIHDPYATWLSEIMLQQTRVATVMERYSLFLERFPTLQSLAEADEATVLALWSGLGYYRRARMLHRGAQFVVRELGGQLPRTAAELRTLPGVGAYTAAAIASIAFGESVAVVDGNVERVLLRLLGPAENKPAVAAKHAMRRKAELTAPPVTLPRPVLARIAQQLVPAAKRGKANLPGDHNQAMMELGATLCLPRAPLCLQCPLLSLCKTRGEHVTAPRAPQQSRTVAHLLTVRKRGTLTEVLLERRPATAGLMPGMLELPPLPLDAVAGREPVLRLRHAITNTNYYVQVYAEGAPALPPSPLLEQDAPQEDSTVPADALDDEYDAVFTAAPEAAAGHGGPQRSLLDEVPAAAADLEWFAVSKLVHLPLTGLARKALQRLGLMQLPRLQAR